METIEKVNLVDSLKEFLNNSYLFTLENVLLTAIEEFPKEDKFSALIFDKTIFHPQGGGQPSDEGEIELIKNGLVLKIEGLGYDRERDVVFHKISKDVLSKSDFTIGDTFNMKINEEKRRLYARLHSAGHLLDLSITRIGLNLVPGKGYHFAEGPYVEYNGNIDKNKTTELMKQIEDISNEIIEKSEDGDTTITRFYSYEEGKKEFGNIPSYLPVDKPFRWVKLLKNENGCPCGGTHVQHIKDIQSLKINKISNKGKVVRISYNVI